MDIKPTNEQNANDDQEIAKVLAGVNEQIEGQVAGEDASGLEFETTPAAGVPAIPPEPITPPAAGAVLPTVTPLPTDDDDELAATAVAPEPAPEAPSAPVTPVADAAPSPAPAADSSLDGIKKDALTELRPLVDKLNVSAEERFDTYLLLIRSTDDKSLIGPAHEAAKEIKDDARRAQALLDVIKEIDYLSQNAA